jgi:hypothetical protein
VPGFGRAGGAGGGGGCFEFAAMPTFADGRFGNGGRGGGGGGVLGNTGFLLTELSDALVLSKLSIVLSSESLRCLFTGNDDRVDGESDSSRFGDFRDGEFSTKIASPSSTESKLSCGGDVGLSNDVDPISPLRNMDGDCDKYFSGINESARFSLYGLPKLTINLDRTRACAESVNSPVFGSKKVNGIASSSTDHVGDPSTGSKVNNIIERDCAR